MIFDFNYILIKIKNAEFIQKPFPHLDIKNFLSKEHLNLILNEEQIHFGEKINNDHVYYTLLINGWEVQHFPGCTTNWEEYKKNLKNIEKIKSNDPVENVGITFRLKIYKNFIIRKLIDFMNGDSFHNALKDKFNINDETNIISAIQKNLSGYEISPHPDKRNKCLTYLLNINNNEEIEKLDCHTHLLEFKNDFKYIQECWKNNNKIDRCWVPWEWCRTVKTMNKNNSLLIFHPDNDPPTLHAIRLNYNHLKYQRTQIYGNLMYKFDKKLIQIKYKDFI